MVMFRLFLVNLIRGPSSSPTKSMYEGLKKIPRQKRPGFFASRWKVAQVLADNSKEAQRQILEHQMMILEELKEQNARREINSDRVKQRQGEMRKIREHKEKMRIRDYNKQNGLER